MRALLGGLAAAVVLLSGCVTGEGSVQQQPRDGRAGLQLTGTVAGAQVAVSDGNPLLVVGDCDVVGGPADDVCVASRDVRGQEVGLVVRNPGVLAEGAEVVIEDPECRGPACDDVTGAAVVDVTIGETRHRATGGTLHVTALQEDLRYAANVRIELPGGVLSGHLDVVARPG